MKRKKLKYAKEFEFPPSVMLDGVNLSIYSNIGCSVDHFGEILTYTSELIRLNTQIGVLKICGENMMIEEMDDDTLMLTGRIYEVSYEKNK